MDEIEKRKAWDAMCNEVTDQMKVYTRPFVNILFSDIDGKPTEIGTGTYIDFQGRNIITCEHVSKYNPNAIYIHDEGQIQHEIESWQEEKGKDLALATINQKDWEKIEHSATTIPISFFDENHSPIEHELLFFRGIAGENIYVSADGADAIISGYCSQENPNFNDENIFEILWDPEKIRITEGTDPQVKNKIKYNNPQGFSGSLVWNTHFVESGCDFKKWTPEMATITGIVRKYDEKKGFIIARKIERIHEFLKSY